MPNEIEKIKEPDLEPNNTNKVYRLGWVRDLPDYRDQMYHSSLKKIEAPMSLPSRVDLRRFCPAVYDQGNLGSCTANAIGAAFQFSQMKQNLENWVPSRLFIYYNERNIENTVSSDSGAQIRDGIKTINQLGVAPETSWPYDVSQFAVKPPDSVFTEARQSRMVDEDQQPIDDDKIEYYRLNNTDINELKCCLNKGFPWVFGVSVYSSFMNAQNGYIPMPSHWDSCEGGHAILGVGYDDNITYGKVKGAFIFRNSWGTGWGEKGYGYLPYRYVTNPRLSSDFWTIRDISGKALKLRRLREAQRLEARKARQKG